MEYLKRLEPLALFLLMLGGLNWAILGFFHENVIADIVGGNGGTGLDAVYAVVGAPALVFVPRLLEWLMERLHIDIGHPRPHGA